MAKNVENTEVVKDTEKDAPVVLYSYTVKRLSNNTWDFDGLPVKDGDTPSIDRLNIAKDIIELGRRLDHQLTVEEAVKVTLENLAKIAQESK